MTDVLRAGLQALVEQLAAGQTDAACYATAVTRLVGLGPGLTPSGDDLLVALVAAARRFVSDRGAGRVDDDDTLCGAAADGLATALAQLPPGVTTDVAHRLLNEAVAGRFPEPLAEFVGALGDPGVDQATLAALVERLAATGAHSGADWLAGVAALARACLR